MDVVNEFCQSTDQKVGSSNLFGRTKEILTN